MKHFGDIMKLRGDTLPVVDVISFGSPCQDVSLAGGRKGLKHAQKGDDETTRSGLFFESIRVIKEMREHDKSNGRADWLLRPRYGILENVPGLFSSNSGEDFGAVLTEIARIVCPDAPDVPMPGNGKWPHAGYIFGVGESGVPFSVAWKLHDAQYWGVPQRRKRLCVLADFNGLTAPEILFDPEYRREAPNPESYETLTNSCRKPGREVSPVGEGVSRYPQQSGEEGQGTAPGTEESVGGAISFQERAGKPGGAKDS